jgi:hypothetical protein
MREPQTIFLILVVITCIISAGCVQSSGNSSVTPAVATSVPTLEPVTIVPTTTATSAPREVVTIIRYVSPLKDVKDSYLLFTLQVPVEWNVSTYRMMNSDTSDYRTDLVAGNVFSIDTYVITRGREQEYRDRFRQWIPGPVETTETINDIRYDRFESRACGNTSVAYIAHTNSANERGYASVLVFTARDSNRFEKEDFEKVVSSFRYFSMKSAGAIPGEEIPVYDLSGNAVSRNLNPMLFNSSDWDSAGGSSIDLGSPGGGSSNEGSPGGGTCPSGSTITVG